ncbi:sulfatase-like hydrolase/transferase [Desulfovibrio sp.]|uniref:sulfatase-like hydrolase/transferase n=2 Tax=Desulfovibrio sp. TaxID=885 RepID=UPI003AB8DE75
MAGQSLTTQYLSGVDIRGLVLADIAASLLLVLVCGTRFLRIVSLLQGLLSLFCLSYAASMGMPPTLAAILNGSRQIAGMDLRSLWTYIDPAALVALSLLVAIQCWLCGHKPRYRHRWLAIIPACALLATQYNACLLQPPRHFTPEFILGEGRSRFEPPARRSLKYRGYLGTFLMELGSGTAFTPPYVPARTCSSAWTDQIPVPAAPSQLALVQVESLDFELLEMDVDGRPVMPFLRSLLPDAILLRLDGTKKLASANSDFELFNGLEASPDFVHYEYEYAYPRSLIAQLGSGGRPVEVFHGLPANYMNLRAAYKLQGFSRYHDIEVMRAAGVRPLDCWWAGVVTDKDLFDYAAQQMPSGPFVQFIITMSMHLPEYVDRIAPERRFCSSSRSAFLTLAHDTDIALRHYVAKLPQGAMLILWGDHRSYSRDNSGLIPFLVYIKGASLHFDGRDLPVMSRCSMYYYLQKIFCKTADALF